MIYLLLALICVTSGIIGYALALVEGSAWSVVAFSIGALASLQIVYVATLIVRSMV